MLQFAGLLVLGIATGYFSGLIGLGGGVLIVPALIYFFGLSQPQAQGTTLAMMLPPIGLMAVMVYNQKGLIDWRIAGILCIGFLIGSPFGAKLAVGLSTLTLKRIFSVSLFLISLKMFFGK